MHEFHAYTSANQYLALYQVPGIIPGMKPDGATISMQLRHAICASKKTVYAISKESGIDEGTLSRFKDGKVGLSLKNVDLLGACLGLCLTRK